MERLTTKGYKYNSLDFMDDGMHYFANKLSRYEDTGLTPEEIIDGKLRTGWIPVTERLPENVTEIVTEEEYMRQTKLVTDGEAVITMIYENGEFRDIINREKICDCVTAWMPLPQPYRP